MQEDAIQPGRGESVTVNAAVRSTNLTFAAARDVAELAATLVDQVVPDCEGACLGTSALIAYTLSTRGVPAAAVRGEYDEHAHWWLEVDHLRIDATRAQFSDGKPLVEDLTVARDEDPYTVEHIPGPLGPGASRHRVCAHVRGAACR